MTTLDVPQITIIVPVYNAEKYLDQCLRSIVTQTYRNLEVILVDDGSTDNSGEICDQYASSDSRIIVIHQSNMGVSHSRNIGIEKAKGDYIIFVDSDDWIDEKLCETLLDAVITYNVEAAVCAYIREYPNKSLPKILHERNTVFSGKVMQRIICGPIAKELENPENMDSYGTLWGHIYPARVLKKHEVMDLSKIGTAEDVLYNFKIFSDIKNIVYVIQPLYHYRKDVKTSITSTYKPDLWCKWERLYSEFKKVIQENDLDPIYYQALSNRIAINTLGLGLNCVEDNASFYEKYKRIKAIPANSQRKDAMKCLMLENMPIYWKFFFVCAKCRLSFMLCVLLLVISNMRGQM